MECHAPANYAPNSPVAFEKDKRAFEKTPGEVGKIRPAGDRPHRLASGTCSKFNCMLERHSWLISAECSGPEAWNYARCPVDQTAWVSESVIGALSEIALVLTYCLCLFVGN